jgi:hypothetical protein
MIKRDCFDKGNTTFDEIVTMMQGITQIQGACPCHRSSRSRFYRQLQILVE